jgi:hypothetical protein
LKENAVHEVEEQAEVETEIVHAYHGTEFLDLQFDFRKDDIACCFVKVGLLSLCPVCLRNLHEVFGFLVFFKDKADNLVH